MKKKFECIFELIVVKGVVTAEYGVVEGEGACSRSGESMERESDSFR